MHQLPPPRSSSLDLDYSAGERAFRDEVRAWLGANLPAGLRDKVTHYEHLTRVSTAPGARTGLYVASRAALYVAAPAHSGATAAIRVYAVR